MQPITLGERQVGYHLEVKPQRRMTFKYNGKEYIAYGSSKSINGAVTPANYRQGLDNSLDQLLLNYLKANPKPKEKKSLIEP